MFGKGARMGRKLAERMLGAPFLVEIFSSREPLFGLIYLNLPEFVLIWLGFFAGQFGQGRGEFVRF